MTKQVIFEDLFKKNDWKPLRYKKQLVYPFDAFRLKSENQKIKIVFQQTDSPNIQAVSLSTRDGFIVEGERIKKGLILRQDTIPSRTVNLVAVSKDKNMVVKNVTFWKNWAGHEMRSSGNGSAMIVQELPNGRGRSYRCNDVEPDDDFNDLIFRIEYADDNKE